VHPWVNRRIWTYKSLDSWKSRKVLVKRHSMKFTSLRIKLSQITTFFSNVMADLRRTQVHDLRSSMRMRFMIIRFLMRGDAWLNERYSHKAIINSPKQGKISKVWRITLQISTPIVHTTSIAFHSVDFHPTRRSVDVLFLLENLKKSRLGRITQQNWNRLCQAFWRPTNDDRGGLQRVWDIG